MRRHLVVFAKAPLLGRVKTRLARGIGALEALRFHRLATERLVRRIGRDKRWTLTLATTPGPPFRVRAPTVPQGVGDLGQRMRRALRQRPPGPVVIIGSDIPEIAPRHIAAAFRALGTHDLVLGPATDGGYWLVGARRRPFLPRLFDAVRWSTADALADTLATAPKRCAIALIDTLEDVDDAASWRRHRSAAVPRLPAAN